MADQNKILSTTKVCLIAGLFALLASACSETSTQDSLSPSTSSSLEPLTTQTTETSTLVKPKYTEVLMEFYDGNFSEDTIECLVDKRLSFVDDVQELERRLNSETDFTNEDELYSLPLEDGLFENTSIEDQNEEVLCWSDEELNVFLDVYYGWPDSAPECLLEETGSAERVKEAVFFESSLYKAELQECAPWVVDALGL